MEQIEHPATIIKIAKNHVEAQVEVKSACGSCAMQGSCGIGNCANKTIEIAVDNPQVYHVGEKITVTLAENFGFFALFYGYILPLIFVLFVLFGSLAFGSSEIRSGIYAIIVLIPYYFGLSLAKKYFQRKFQFKIAEK